MTNGSRLRRPQAFDPDDPSIQPTPPLASDDTGERAAGKTSAAEMPAAPADDAEFKPSAPRSPEARALRPPRFVSGWTAAFLTALLSLLLLAAGIWLQRFIDIALARDDWLGIAANALLVVVLATGGVIVLREIFGIWRLARLGRVRRLSEAALASGDVAVERQAVSRLKSLLGARRDQAWHLARFREEERHMRAPGALLGLADRVLLAAPDQEARRIVYQSARRVGMVTAMVPVAFLSMLFVLSEILRMIRRLATAYGGRPGFIGGVRLFSGVIAHIAATGAIILTDDLIGQFFGQDLARRLSRRLGEGAFNAALTARLGVAAIAICRPLPFIAAKPIRVRAILTQVFPELSPTALVRGMARRRTSQPAASADRSARTDDAR